MVSITVMSSITFMIIMIGLERGDRALDGVDGLGVVGVLGHEVLVLLVASKPYTHIIIHKDIHDYTS